MSETKQINAVVTGCTSGIGRAITCRLLDKGYRVYGFGRDFSKIEEICNRDDFFGISCDLSKFRELESAVKEIEKDVRKNGEKISLLVNCAGVGYFGPHEQINPNKLHEMAAVNLEAPLILTSMLLRDLKDVSGMVINISSVTAKKVNTHGCAYGATKAGLTSFGNSLFDEVRKYGVRVANIHPDMTASDFYRNADFTEGSSEDTYLLPEEVADFVEELISLRAGMSVTDITLQPIKHQIVRKK